MSIYRIVDLFISCRLCFLCYFYFICHFFRLLSTIFGLLKHQQSVIRFEVWICIQLCLAEFNGKTKFEGCKVWHSWKITADRRGKRRKIFSYGWKKSDMVRKLLRLEGDKRYSWEKSDMVGKILRIQGGNAWKYSQMVGKSLTWSENYSGWKAPNSNMVEKFPQGVRKCLPLHRSFSLFHPSYR